MIPVLWKSTFVVPLHKSSDVLDFNNCCPISKFPLLAKILGLLVNLQLHAFADSLNLLHPQQSGFLPGNSTITAAVSVINNIVSHLDKRNVVLLSSLMSQKHLIPSIIKSYSTSYSLQVQIKPRLIGSTLTLQRELRLLLLMVLSQAILPSET